MTANRHRVPAIRIRMERIVKVTLSTGRVAGHYRLGARCRHGALSDLENDVGYARGFVDQKQ